MEVILLEKIKDLGNIGDLVTVKGGFARNFLIPRRKALRATKENKVYFEQKRAEYEEENAKRKQSAKELSEKVSGLCINLIMQAGDDGRLYGSVMSKDISNIINKDHDAPVKKEQIVLAEKIKEIGIYNLALNLHPEVTASIKLNIARSNEEAEIAIAELQKESDDKPSENVNKEDNIDAANDKKEKQNTNKK